MRGNGWRACSAHELGVVQAVYGRQRSAAQDACFTQRAEDKQMTTRKQNLTALRDAMVAGSWYGDTTEFFTEKCHIDCFNAVVGDMNAAIAFVAAVLPGWRWEVYITGKYPGMILGSPTGPYGASIGLVTNYHATASTPALALTVAALNALVELEDAK